MRVVVQRVKKVQVDIEGKTVGKIHHGLLVLIGFEVEESSEEMDWLVRKICNLRIFADENGVMNRSALEVNAGILLVSQFTLYASTKKGNRPSYIKAAKPEVAIPYYLQFIEKLEQCLGREIETGEFGADMDISLVNNGPVTIIIDTKDKN